MKEKSLSLFFLIMISSAFVISIRNLPTIAETQMQMIFFALFGTIIFFIPGALVSAELATGWPSMGGIAVWTEEAFGKKIGFLASWFQWIYMVISIIAMLFFISSSLAYVFDPKLANSAIYLLILNLILIWVFTLINLKGITISKIISTIGFLLGVLFPAILIILSGLIYVFQGNPIQMDFSLNFNNLVPNFKDLSTIVLLVGFMRAFGGIEASAAHANNVANPQKNYPIAILIVVLIGLLINLLGSLSVAIVIPQKEISLTSGVMVAFDNFLKMFNLSFFIPVLGLLVAIGQMGGFSTWITGPVKALLQCAKEGDLPTFFRKVNKHNVPTHLMITQAIIISILGSFFLIFLDNINIAFWISVALSMISYMSMYFLMFLSALYLRYKKPEVERKFKIPFKNIGMWIVSIIGMAGMILSFLIAFIPPSQLSQKNNILYYSILIIGTILIFLIPFIILYYQTKKKHE